MDTPHLDPTTVLTPAVATSSEAPSDLRAQRGLALLRTKGKRVRHVSGDVYFIPSQTGTGGYIVDLAATTCVCDDFALHGEACKHLWAAGFLASGGTVEETADVEAPKKPTYKQVWPAYNRAQCEEREVAARLLRGLCDGIQQPPRVPGRAGRPSLPLADVVFGATMKVYTTVSGRRATSDIRVCEERGLIEHTPAYNSIFKYVERESLRPLLTQLVEESATPLRALERDFAVDSTGFSTNTYARWFDAKYGGEKKAQRWIKAHAMVGVVTNIITAVKVTEGYDADCPELLNLAKTTKAKGFTLREVSGDKAYLSNDNLEGIEALGAAPYIPFKVNSSPTGETEVWQRLYYHLFALHRTEFCTHYHKRSNIESTFGAVKAKFGAALRSKELDAQLNEALLKCLCFNLSMLVHAIREFQIDPKFWLPTTQVQKVAQ